MGTPQSGPVGTSSAANASSSTGVLPLDTVYEILMRLPARDLCRLRTVCRPWRSLLSDPKFISVHAVRHPDDPPLIVAHHADPSKNKGALFDVVDLSGNVLKQVVGVTTVGGEEDQKRVTRSTQLDLVTYSRRTSFRLLDPTTGTVHALPDGLAKEHDALHEPDVSDDYAVMVASSRIDATGELKVLRVLDSYPNASSPGQLCEVCTLGEQAGGHARWRRTNAPPHKLDFGHWRGAVISGVAYFLSDEWIHDQDAGPDRVASFNLETEEWRPSLKGPLSSLLNGTDEDYNHDTYFDWYDYRLASLSGRLVLVHSTPMPSADLWVLMDAEKGSWVMQHRIETSFEVHPLLGLNDDRVVFVRVGCRGSVMVYNPRTNILTDTSEGRVFYAVGLYTGSLLTLANMASVN